MAERAALGEARRALTNAHETHASLCEPFLAAFPITGAAISVLGGTLGQSTICSSDPVADRIDELQFDLGEGPCWTALSSKRPVLQHDLRVGGVEHWPMFTQAVLSDATASGVRALFAFPLSVGSIELGAIDLYSTQSQRLESSLVAEVMSLAELASWQVLRRVLDDHASEFKESIGYSRREVHQATGMLIVQLGVAPEEAELVLRAHAFSSGRSVSEIANDVVERRLDFSQRARDDRGAEE